MDLAASDSLAPLLKEMEMNFMLAAVIERLCDLAGVNLSAILSS